MNEEKVAAIRKSGKQETEKFLTFLTEKFGEYKAAVVGQNCSTIIHTVLDFSNMGISPMEAVEVLEKLTDMLRVGAQQAEIFGKDPEA